jgi:hypothetical protein
VQGQGAPDLLPNIDLWATEISQSCYCLSIGDWTLLPRQNFRAKRPHSDTCGDRSSGVRLGSCRDQRTHSMLRSWRSNPHEMGDLGAGGTRIAPAPCGCGACCRPFSYAQERTRAHLKSPILMAPSIKTFTSVHQRSPAFTSVHQRSPAFTSVHQRWGQRWSNQLDTLRFSECP